MRFRGRVERLERRKGAVELPCPGCGWTGQCFTYNEYVDAEGRTVRVTDWQGHPLPAKPENGPSCDLCRGHRRIFIAVRCPIGADGPAGVASHES